VYPVKATTKEVTPFHFREWSLLGCRVAGDAARHVRVMRRPGAPRIAALGCNQLQS